MRWQRLYKAELLVSLKDVSSIIIIIIAIIGSLIIGSYQSTEAERNLSVAIVNLDKGALGQKLTENLENEEGINTILVDLEQAKKLLRKDDVETVAIIDENFTDEIEKGNYEDVVTIINSSSSKYHATVIEPLINNITVIWMQKRLLVSTKEFYGEYGLEFYNEVEYLEKCENIRKNGSNIKLNKMLVEDTKGTSKLSSWIDLSSAWYAVFVLFYFIISGTWMLEISKRNLRSRAEREGMSQAKMYIAISLAKLTLVFSGYLIVLIVSIGTEESFVHLINNLIGMLIYLVGILGFSLTVTVFASGLTSLMLLAPLLTFLTGTLSGLILNLPSWAYMFEVISRILPGRWYHSALLDSPNYLIGIACSLLWCLLGYILSRCKSVDKKGYKA
ncbi:MAG: ABC transporter permease [Clostridiales bacterium]|nr:ABC transporter permease [Clostridiales bacterium]